MSEKDNDKMSNKEMIETVIALEEGKKQGLTSFQIGIAMGIKKAFTSNNKSKNDKKKR